VLENGQDTKLNGRVGNRDADDNYGGVEKPPCREKEIDDSDLGRISFLKKKQRRRRLLWLGLCSTVQNHYLHASLRHGGTYSSSRSAD